MANHSSVLTQRILWTEEPGGLPSMGSHRAGHDWSDAAAAAAAAAAADSGHQRALSRVPYAIQYVGISYLFDTQYQQCIHVNPKLPIHPTLVSMHLLSTSLSLFLIIYAIFFQIPYICIHYIICSFRLTSLHMTVSRSIQVSPDAPTSILTTRKELPGHRLR